MRVERKMRGERAFSRPALSGRKRKDMHTSPTEGAAADGRDPFAAAALISSGRSQCARQW
jgi:hypothetical protein